MRPDPDVLESALLCHGAQRTAESSAHSPEVAQRENAGHAICVCTTSVFINTYVLGTYDYLAPLDPFKGRNYVFYYLSNTTQGPLGPEGT